VQAAIAIMTLLALLAGTVASVRTATAPRAREGEAVRAHEIIQAP
jgi:uncharacterized membrane protein